jgi:hypothetical protein
LVLNSNGKQIDCSSLNSVQELLSDCTAVHPTHRIIRNQLTWHTWAKGRIEIMWISSIISKALGSTGERQPLGCHVSTSCPSHVPLEFSSFTVDPSWGANASRCEDPCGRFKCSGTSEDLQSHSRQEKLQGGTDHHVGRQTYRLHVGRHPGRATFGSTSSPRSCLPYTSRGSIKLKLLHKTRAHALCRSLGTGSKCT